MRSRCFFIAVSFQDRVSKIGWRGGRPPRPELNRGFANLTLPHATEHYSDFAVSGSSGRIRILRSELAASRLRDLLPLSVRRLTLHHRRTTHFTQVYVTLCPFRNELMND